MGKIIYLLSLTALIPLTHISHIYLNTQMEERKIEVEEKYNLPSPELTKIVSLGYDNLLADLLWLQMIQYYGKTIMDDRAAPDIPSLLNNIIELDPHFIDAYIFGSYALVDNEQFDKAITLLNRGIDENPKEWYLAYQAALLYYIYEKNKPVAIKYLTRAAEAEGAPPLPSRLAAKMAETTDTDLEVREQLWDTAYNKAKQEGDKVNMEKAYKNLVEIKIEKDIQMLNRAIKRYNELAGIINKVPAAEPSERPTPSGNGLNRGDNTSIEKMSRLENLKMLADRGIIDKVPLDPFNRPYLFNPETLEVTSYPLPWDKKD